MLGKGNCQSSKAIKVSLLFFFSTFTWHWSIFFVLVLLVCCSFLHIISSSPCIYLIHTHSTVIGAHPWVSFRVLLWLVSVGGHWHRCKHHRHKHTSFPVGAVLQRLFEKRRRRISPLIPTIPLTSFSKYPQQVDFLLCKVWYVSLSDGNLAVWEV